MGRNRHEIGRTQVALSILVLAVIGTAAVYFVYPEVVSSSKSVQNEPTPTVSGTMPSSTQTTTVVSSCTSPAPQSTATPTTSGASASSSEKSSLTSSTSSCTSSLATPSAGMVPQNFDALLGNLSQMSMSYQIAVNGTSAGGNFSGSASYSVIGRPEVNSTVLYKVLVNSTSLGVAQGMTVWFTPAGNAVIAELNGQNLTGASAQGPANLALIPFYLELYTVQRLGEFTNSTFVGVLNQTTSSLGPTSILVTYYKPKSLPFTEASCGQTITVNQMLLGSGVVPGSSFVVATYFEGEVTMNSAISVYMFRVTSLKV